MVIYRTFTSKSPFYTFGHVKQQRLFKNEDQWNGISRLRPPSRAARNQRILYRLGAGALACCWKRSIPRGDRSHFLNMFEDVVRDSTLGAKLRVTLRKMLPTGGRCPPTTGWLASCYRLTLKNIRRQLGQFGALALGHRDVGRNKLAFETFNRIGQSGIGRVDVRVVDLEGIAR